MYVHISYEVCVRPEDAWFTTFTSEVESKELAVPQLHDFQKLIYEKFADPRVTWFILQN